MELSQILVGAGILLGAYVLGSVPSGLVMGRLIAGADVRRHGSGNIGMVNVFRAAGPVAGVSTFLLDGLKGFLPVFVATRVDLPLWEVLLVAATAILGHNYSILLGGRGGKGVATSIGTIGAIAPGVALFAIIIWVVLLITTRYASLASLLMIACLPVLLIASGFGREFVLFAIALLVLAIYQHRSNIARLLRGSELKIHLGSTAVRHGD